MSDTVTVKVWSGDRFDSYEDILSYEPKEYEMEPCESTFGKIYEVPDEERVYLSESIEHHGTYAFDVETDDLVFLNVHTNDSFHSPDAWGKPIERGLLFDGDDDYGPFKTEIWGRIVMWVEQA